MVALILINVPMNYLYTDYRSQATRYAETGLRKALIRKLQELSTQMFLSILNISLNIGVALVVTVSKSFIVFLFFLITAPVAAITMVSFRNIMKKRNAEFRKEMEEEEVQKMSSQLFAVAEKGYKLDLIQALFGSVGWAAFQIFQIVCLAFTGYLAFQGNILAGDITLYQSYFSTIVNQVSAIIALVPTIAKGIESVNSIGEVLLSEEVEHNEDDREMCGVWYLPGAYGATG